MIKKKLISVCLISYNHAAFISETFEGILMQKIDADIEVIVGDDCSQDGTVDIIKDYEKKFPDVIQYIPREKNVGMMKNFISTLKGCKGEFIAICEGDDYWTDPLKLQNQLDILSRSESFTLCFTDLRVLQKNLSNVQTYYNYDVKKNYSLRDLLGNNPIVTCTVMFKNVVNEQLLSELAEFKIGDWPLYILLLQKTSGVAIFHNVKTSVYRRHQQGAYSNLNVLSRLYIDLEVYQTLYKLDKFKKYHLDIKKRISKTAYAIGCRIEDKIDKKKMYRKSLLSFNLLNFTYPFKSLIRLLTFNV